MVEEQAEATEELITALTENHTQQMETLIKNTTNAMKEMMSLIKNEQKAPKINQIMQKRRSNRKDVKHTMKHLSVNTVQRSILPKQKMSVGNWRKTKTPAHPIGSHQKAPEGERGP
jgi:hypothetical protein